MMSKDKLTIRTWYRPIFKNYTRIYFDGLSKITTHIFIYTYVLKPTFNLSSFGRILNGVHKTMGKIYIF